MEAVGYTSREAAGLFGLKPARVRAMARSGLLSPTRGERHEYRFTFQDLVLLRSLKSLLDSRLPRRRVHNALRQLVHQMPADRKLSEVRLAADAGRILAQDGDLLWNPESGQVLFDFNTTMPSAIEPLAPPPHTTRDAQAEDWYQHGLDLEPFDPDGARAAYHQALAIVPRHAGSHVNLGRLLQAIGAPAEAIKHYRAALETEPGHVMAAFNLGTALEEVGEDDEAIAAYRGALRIDPMLADVHYNLSQLYQRNGHKLPALLHLKKYRELVGSG